MSGRAWHTAIILIWQLALWYAVSWTLRHFGHLPLVGAVLVALAVVIAASYLAAHLVWRWEQWGERYRAAHRRSVEDSP